MRLIDADKGLISKIQRETGCNFITAQKIVDSMPKVEAIVIPKNATNGDMIKAMFPYGKYGTNGNEVHVYGVGGNGCLVFTLEWWNAPYKRGAENE